MLKEPTITPSEPLFTGMHMELDEFLARWTALPDLKNAELIEGVVIVSSPVGCKHGDFDAHMIYWLQAYAAADPTLRVSANITCIMGESAPQPDACLRILSEFGGMSRQVGTLLHGAPELIVEVAESSYAHDFGPKKALYQRSGVREYITLDTLMQKLVWRVLVDGSYVEIQAEADGVVRSRTFPGLSIHPLNVWNLDSRAMLSVLTAAQPSTRQPDNH